MSADERRPTVLVVDDEDDIVAYLTAVLQDHGMRVVVARDAPEATARLREITPDLVVLDIMMPGHTGLSLYRAIRRNAATAGVHVIFLSACSAAAIVKALGQAGGLDQASAPVSYFEKPVALGPFLATVEDVLRLAVMETGP